jgi:transposase-like protein
MPTAVNTPCSIVQLSRSRDVTTPVHELVMSDAHTGLKNAIATTLQGSGWQRCRVHFMRNVLAVVPKGTQDMVASIIRDVQQ